MTRVQRPERPTQFSGTKRRHVTVLLLRLADHVAAHESRRVYGVVVIFELTKHALAL